MRVEPTNKPVLLVLSAYEPTIWRIDAAPGARIAGVRLSGYYEQMVTGLSGNTAASRTVLRRTDKSDVPPAA